MFLKKVKLIYEQINTKLKTFIENTTYNYFLNIVKIKIIKAI